MALKIAKHYWKKITSNIISNNKYQYNRTHLVSGYPDPQIKGHGVILGLQWCINNPTMRCFIKVAVFVWKSGFNFDYCAT